MFWEKCFQLGARCKCFHLGSYADDKTCLLSFLRSQQLRRRNGNCSHGFSLLLSTVKIMRGSSSCTPHLFRNEPQIIRPELASQIKTSPLACMWSLGWPLQSHFQLTDVPDVTISQARVSGCDLPGTQEAIVVFQLHLTHTHVITEARDTPCARALTHQDEWPFQPIILLAAWAQAGHGTVGGHSFLGFFFCIAQLEKRPLQSAGKHSEPGSGLDHQPEAPLSHRTRTWTS